MIESIDVGRIRPVLDRLAEERLIRCDYVHDASALSIVTPWPWCVASADFAFARFVFVGVRVFRVLARSGDETGDLGSAVGEGVAEDVAEREVDVQ